MAGYTCPFCQHAIANSYETLTTYSFDFSQFTSSRATYSPVSGGVKVTPYLTHVEFHKCPNCEKQSIIVKGVGSEVEGTTLLFHPSSAAKQYPSYVPNQIKSDYEEAYAILNLSPKASATLSRRCLQGMIRDFWNVHDKKNLFSEIDAIADEISPSARQALDATRKIGNIGAHMEQDVDKIIDIDPAEAETLLKLIEYLMQEWYINRHDSDVLLDEITAISSAKEAMKKDISHKDD
jgi:hypothetical protein